MILWFAGVSFVFVWWVFKSPALDYRLVILGSVLPVGEVVFGGPRLLHTLIGPVALLAVVMLATQKRRLVRRRWIGLPIGLLVHLGLDGIWANAQVFWWPFLGTSFGGEGLPELGRPLAVVLLMELVGAGYSSRPASSVVPSTSRRSPEPVVIVVVRHGRTAHNAAGRLLGRIDPPLDEVGVRQATALAAAVGPVDRVVSSPLRRARQTAAAFGAEVEIDERWIELDYGEVDGLALSEVSTDMWESWRSDADFCPPGGESLAQLDLRVSAALDELAGTSSDGGGGRTTVVVTHVSPIKAAVTWALGAGVASTWRLWVAQASITRIGIGPRGPILHSFNEVAHLDGL
jgi:broad specificity phosphatase PhoE